MAKADNRTSKRRIGDIGENIACEFLMKRGFEIIERNYLKKWGELDIVARKGRVLRFIEVKSVSCVTLPTLEGNNSAKVTHGTDWPFRPEENMHPGKLRRLARTIQVYLLQKKLDCEWQLDLVTVKMDMQSRQARVELIENIVI